MNQVVTNEQWVEFMNVVRSQSKKTDSLIAENGRKINELLEETKLLSVPVFSVYKDGKIMKMGGRR